MEADKVVTVGSGPYFEAANTTYYLNEAGERFAKAGEIEGKYMARAEVLVQITVPDIFKTGNELVDAACLHSLTRTLQERVQIVGRADSPDWQDEAEGFLGYHKKKVMHELVERAAAAKLDTTESMALRILAKVLARKAGLDKPDKDQAKDLRSQASKMRAENHKWWSVALKKAEAASTEKGFEE